MSSALKSDYALAHRLWACFSVFTRRALEGDQSAGDPIDDKEAVIEKR